MTKLLLVSMLAMVGCEEPALVQSDHPALADHDDDHDDEPIPRVSPERAARVLLTEANGVGRETEVLGVVDAHEKPGHHDEALAELRARAAALDADAVIGMEFHHGEGHGERSHLSGMAVRYRNLLRDEPYDVVGELDVVADMHHQDRAVAELQRRAGELHADLIIHISYRHGDGHEPVHLTGTAIRYRSNDRL